MPMKTLDEWLAWQSTLHPNRMALGLERVADVWSRLGVPGLGCPVITVGGTNGKGSCVALIEAMAQAAGYRTACYTSPHLLRYNERVRINGEAVTDEALCAAFARVEGARGATPLTYFEFGTLAALDLFAAAGPDLVVLEVGLGGRLDAVNLIDADCAVVTSIGRDHMAWLGETPDAIAVEKAGIFRCGRPAIIGQPDAPERLRAQAQLLGAPVFQVGRELGMERDAQSGGWIWRGSDGERLALPIPAMRGAHQLHNAAAALASLRSLRARLPLPVQAIRAGLGRARLPGRFQVVPGTVTWILDVAHNPQAAAALAENLRGFRGSGRVRAVFGVLADKEAEAVAAPLKPLVDAWYLTASRDARAMPAARLAECLSDVLDGTQHAVWASVPEAIDAAVAASAPGDCLLIYGSFTIVGEALARQIE
ncbi:bifunctional tetrahydrofolate synthase/dihydrofolate synthase [uncultured Lamprocystis sp.]|jgi:dihydrofolate synthase/folylpolyglutamate synthase|uniref:bifunctional tetrahydrofolate synthase/dihydrofolate synthase n=1 Tax=uncultured Lamprocystis sp. TaxID=543132 RepID=UPI0025CFF7A3|nr:bifunctional tetrahydrofolate synthase/dihydrofolate synthase [uncultured Lamprocystis sp.]